jgi:hypothetical protein
MWVLAAAAVHGAGFGFVGDNEAGREPGTINKTERTTNMNLYVKFRFEAVERVHFFGEKPELVRTPAETPLFTSITATWTAMKNWGVDQVGGNQGFRAGALERRIARDTILESMREISDMAMGLAVAGTLPAGGEMFRMPRSRTFVHVAAAAQAFADAAEPVKALFIAGGLPATFVEDLEALLPTLDTATGARQTSLFDQTAGTAGLKALADEGLRLIQQLRPMMRTHLKNQPALLEAWNLASRVSRRRDGEEEAAGSGSGAGGSASGSGAGSGSGTTVTG